MHPRLEKLPKTELHVHIEGTMMPDMLLQLADKNGVRLPWQTLQDVQAAYHFKDLTEFVQLYLKATEVVCEAEDFYTITTAYLNRCRAENIRHTEVFCDIRTYTDRGHDAAMVIDGIHQAFIDAERNLDISGGLMPCFVRHLGVQAAAEDWQALQPHRDKLLAIGLAAIEVPHPPAAFKAVFDAVRAAGLPVVAHAGEEGPPEYIASALDDLGAARIDHGIRAMEDPALVQRLAETQVPLTVCPCSNVSLNVCESMADHPIRAMLDAGLNVTINSDDPAHFGAFLLDNMDQVMRHCDVRFGEVVRMSANAIDASFADPDRKQTLKDELAEFMRVD